MVLHKMSHVTQLLKQVLIKEMVEDNGTHEFAGLHIIWIHWAKVQKDCDTKLPFSRM